MTPKLDTNAAWKQALAMISANRDVLLIVAGVFFMLPILAFSIFVAPPELPEALSTDERMARMMLWYTGAIPYMLVTTLVNTVGLLALMRLMADPARPTVREALAGGLRGTPTQLGAQIVIGTTTGLIMIIALTVGSLAGPALGVLLTITALAVAVYIFFRLIQSVPVIAVEQMRNPIAALRRSWAMTRGNTARIALFFILFFALAMVLLSAIMLIVGIVLVIATSGSLQLVLSAVVSSALASLLMLFLAAMNVAVWKQLRGDGN